MLQLFVNNLAEVPGDLRREYALQRDGRWMLVVEGLNEYVGGLRSALKAERQLRKKAEKGFSKVEAKLAEVRRRDAGARSQSGATIKKIEVAAGRT